MTALPPILFVGSHSPKGPSHRVLIFSVLTSRRPGLVALTAGLGLVAGSLAAGITPALANPGGTDLVISEVYGGGGNAGATLTHDFVELYNPTGAPISAAGLTITYYSSSGAAQGNHTLTSGTVPAGGHFLVQEAAGTGGTEALPDPDAEGPLRALRHQRVDRGHPAARRSSTWSAGAPPTRREGTASAGAHQHHLRVPGRDPRAAGHRQQRRRLPDRQPHPDRLGCRRGGAAARRGRHDRRDPGHRAPPARWPARPSPRRAS